MKPALAAALVAGCVGIGHAQDSREQHYLGETSRAMARMMAAMNAAPTGDVDADFVAAMAPHHQGAIEMAQAKLSYGRNQLLRRLAQGIIVSQLQEIEAMNLALGSRPEASADMPERSMPPMWAPQGHHHAP